MEHCISVAVGFLDGGGSTPSPTPTPTPRYGWFYVEARFGDSTNPIVNPIAFIGEGDSEGEANVEIGYFETESDGDVFAIYDAEQGAVIPSGVDVASVNTATFDSIYESFFSAYDEEWGDFGVNNGMNIYNGVDPVYKIPAE